MKREYTILHVLPDLEVGGGQQVVLRNIVGMQDLRGVGTSPASRFSHVVCSIRDGRGMLAQYEAGGVEVEFLGVAGVAGVMGGLRRLRRVVRERGIDLVHTNNTGADRFFGQLCALACGLPVVNTLHAEPPPTCTGDAAAVATLGFKDRLKVTGRDRLTAMTTRHFVAVSERVREAWAAYLRQIGKGEDRVSVVTSGLDTRRFRAEPATVGALRREILGERTGPVLMYVARLVAGKGHEHLTEVMRSVVAASPGAVLALVGDGERRGEIEGAFRAAGLGGCLRLLGDRHDVPLLLASCDLFVFPSLSEGFGLAVLEAMAAGKAVVAFDLPALREFVETDRRRESGVLVGLGDAAAMGDRAVEILRDGARMKTMGERGRRIVEERFSLRASVERLAGVYLKVLEGD
ncbi:MAG: glycosyltransferase family 4 protein [Phycisphaeraceae bacterium]|nr:glycosyltransferase family 4 protein [Phycisphaeraceae bacterium]